MSQSGLFSSRKSANSQTSGAVPSTQRSNSSAAVTAQASGHRLPSQPRERRPGLAALAVLVILASSLGALVLVRQAGAKVSAVEITQRVAPGQHIAATSMTEVLISEESGLKYVPWAQRGLLASQYYSASDIPAGTLLTGPMLTDTAGVAGDEAVVGLSLKAGEYPPGLQGGDRVQVMWVGRDAAARGSSSPAPGSSGGSTGGAVLLAGSATVHEVFKAAVGEVSANLSLSVVVPANEAGAITQAASSGDVALVLVSAGSK